MSTGRVSPLDDLLRKAGATMVEAEGAVVAANFGSVVGEMAVLWHAVGIADRSELAKLELRGAPEFVSQSVEYLSGTPVQARSVMRTKGTWWLPIAPDRMMILCEPRRRDELADSLEEITQPTERSSWVDVTGNYAVIALVGPNAEALLQAAGADDDVQVPGEGCLRDTRLAGRAALLVRETPWEFLLVVRRAEAVDTWLELDGIGGDFGIGNVGHEAIEHSEIGTATIARQVRSQTAR
ncbi:MAG: hypothetical protein AABM29_11470 [Actinomycetota bacterium]|nr:hypothetical protein [Candidatus Limnocylindrales bacterium]